MKKKLFIASTEEGSGKSLVTIGLINALRSIAPKVGYMKPVGRLNGKDSEPDEDAILIKELFKLDDDPADMNPVSIGDNQDDKNLFFERIFSAYNKLSSKHDVIVLEGTDYTSAVSALEFDINAELAQTMAAPVLLVANGYQKPISHIIESIVESVLSFKKHGCRVLSVIINRFSSENLEADTEAIKAALKAKKINFGGILLCNPILSGPRLKEVIDTLQAQLVFQGDDLSRVVTDVKVLAMTSENALSYMKNQDGCLLITPGDRIEHIFAILIAQKSAFYPIFSGLILTGGIKPSENVMQLIEGLQDIGISILSVPDDTYQAALKINQINGKLRSDDREKIDIVNRMVENYIDVKRLYQELGEIQTDIITPQMFIYRIMEMARNNQQRIALPEGEEPRIITAAFESVKKGICQPILLGNSHIIEEQAAKLKIPLDKITIIDPKTADPAQIKEFADDYYELRKHKGVTLEMANEVMLDPVHFATMMVYKDMADGFVSGAIHSTADTLIPVLRIIKTKPRVSLASSVFFMCMPDRVLVYGDCALVENPDANQLADIAISSAETAVAFGIKPYVAMLSYSTGTSGRGKDVDKIREATEIARQKRPDLMFEGPIQYDAATSEEVAKVKLKNSQVAGKASVYIFPDLNAGNTAYKAVQRSANVPAIGPVMQGLKKPANDLSRGATVTDILYTMAVTAVQAISNRK
ncbi:MAG: phosphate acetyltransferase [Spirochaetales bacterium]|nr:phosphate acetyltransferase [Spirochaetales bacterium]